MASTGASSSTRSALGDFFFGWDLLFRTIDGKMNKKSDIIMALVHFLLVKQGNFRCLGIGEDKTMREEETGSEILPDGWCDTGNKYALRYEQNGSVFLLLGHISENTLLINLLNVKSKRVSNIALEPDTLVKSITGSLNELIPEVTEVFDRLRKELLYPVFDGTTRHVTTQTMTPSNRENPLRISDPLRPTGHFVPAEPRPFGIPEIGRGDLDPLGRGGGNLFPFPSRPDFNVGPAQPRFDPFGPPDPRIQPNPNPDNFQPPSYGGGSYYM